MGDSAPAPGGAVLNLKKIAAHSLYSLKAKHPKELRVTAETEDGIIMAVQHVSLPMAAVQFHPESILTRTDLGLQMLRNALSQLRY